MATDRRKPKKKPVRKRPDSSFRHQLNEVMLDHNLSLDAVAKICGVSKSVVFDWTQGAIPQDFSKILKLCKACEVDFQWLMTGERPTREHPSSAPQKKHFSLDDICLDPSVMVDADPEFSGIFLVEMKRIRKRKPS